MILFPTETISAEKKLNLGIVNPDAIMMTERFTPLLKYLSGKGIPAGEVVTTKSLGQMIHRFKAGKVDFFFESPYGALKLMDAAGAAPILIREKKGVKKYNSVIFVKKDSPIKSISDLKGKVLAFEDETSTSSHLLPRSLLTAAGLELKKFRKPIPGVVAYHFTKSDSNTIDEVAGGKRADAGGIKKSEVEGNPEFRMLSPESPLVPRHVVIVRKGIAHDRLKSVLLNMKNDPEAQGVLKTIRTPTGFSEFDGDPTQIMTTMVRKALGL
ncbi:MAG: phosphate/phosphite/phosphonate ABC transporter substrate-binding protein [Desulfobacterales bacterium]|nr:phosphate/phosphite/phosphonate ABC transporter substrate-binding protein [Desulfobacterales bacterium]